MAEVVVILYEPVIAEMRGWAGEIGRSTLRLARDIRTAQMGLAPRKTGRLMSSIEVGRLGRWAMGIETEVGANPAGGRGPIGVAYWQEKGTRPHIIRAHNPTGYMTFFWPKVGSVVNFQVVSHPGNPATHWAERGAALGMAAWV